jgi:hypothetical protein
MPDPIPPDAVWFDPDEFRQMVSRWLADFAGARYATDVMDKAHGDWTVKDRK